MSRLLHGLIGEGRVDLSIVIPTYNRNNSVAECVRSLEHNHAEIIVVDDGSSDDTEKVMDAEVKKDQRIRYIKKENGGQSSSPPDTRKPRRMQELACAGNEEMQPAGVGASGG